MSYGIVTIQGREYIERVQLFTATVSVTVGLALMPNLRLTLPGMADFFLKALSRDVVDANGAVATRRFRFRWGNSDGGIWYNSGGAGATNDRVIDPLTFGTGQFPYQIIPGVLFGANTSIMYEVEDLSNTVPYTIHLGFHGSYLLPK